MGGEQPALAVRGLHKRYGSVAALGGVDLEVGEGELVGLLGPNGAGKSTLVKIACGLVRPSAGSATIRGAAAGSAEAQRTLGYLAQLFPLPARAGAAGAGGARWAPPRRPAGSAGGAAERRDLLGQVGLADVASRKIGTMSKG